ncbi:hypothetical protein F0P96_06875 [Hymenobacter busanensis]|uniref:Uncharacterized protein n=1 Tax=Hymenobacter busanensis TaxID=2607656 RepID=A0A7L5A3E5_9BACT|nr:hypothetical protein [Hymenobacter busanensis]KAA9338550.1 hypothetical protein F0P96_06875 [Hymenobacter busanensis]QHJ09022.1 hypothetical protein GUY19_17725 [Hymenobacter busanensis]
MSEPTEPAAGANALPPDFYEKLAPCLNMCGMGCMQLFTRPNDPLPQEITALTGLDMAETRMISAINSNDTLSRQFMEEPGMLYMYLLVGRLALESPLAEPVLHYLKQSAGFNDQQLTGLHEHALNFGATMVELVGNYVASSDEDASALELLRLQVEGAFARLTDTLTIVDVTQPEAAEPEENLLLDLDAEPVLEIGFLEPQLQMLRLAVNLTKLLPLISDSAFAQALPALRGCPAPALDALADRLSEAEAEARIPLSLPELVVLYQATQVLAMALLSNVLDVLRWQEVMGDAERETPMSAEDFSQSQEIICSMISGFVEFVQENFADEPVIAEVRAETVALADLL